MIKLIPILKQVLKEEDDADNALFERWARIAGL